MQHAKYEFRNITILLQLDVSFTLFVHKSAMLFNTVDFGRVELWCHILPYKKKITILTRLKKIKKNQNKYHIGWGIEVAPMIGTSDPSGVFEVAASISFLKKEKICMHSETNFFYNWTESGQQYSHDSNFLNIFHRKLHSFHNSLTTSCRKYVNYFNKFPVEHIAKINSLMCGIMTD